MHKYSRCWEEVTALMNEESLSSLTVLQVKEKYKRIKREGRPKDSSPNTKARRR